MKKIDQLPNSIPCFADAKWKGNEQEYMTIGNLKILMDDWLAFFGLWLAEGWTVIHPKAGYRVGISQKISQKQKIEEILNRLPIKYYVKIDGKSGQWNFNNESIHSHLKQFGKAKSKYMPNWIFTLSKRQLKILYDWLIFGDGTKKGNRESFYTTSERLANDFQRLLLHLGFKGSILNENKKGFNKHLIFTINKRLARIQYIKKESIKKKHYKGKIYCVEVPNHIIYVRRNGKPMWTGNSFDSICYLCADWGDLEGTTQAVINAIYEELGLPKPKEINEEESPFFSEKGKGIRIWDD
jgi:hypothetical protein